MSILLVIGFVGGIAVGTLSNFVFYNLYCLTRGIPYKVWDNSFISLTGVLILGLTILAGNSVRQYIRKMDWIAQMYTL